VPTQSFKPERLINTDEGEDDYAANEVGSKKVRIDERG
jgi:hypothetical protein